MKQMKKIAGVIITAVTISGLAAGCGSSNDILKDEDVTVWEISEEAKAKRDVLYEQRIENFDAEEYYEKMKTLYETRTVQNIPNATVNNNLNKETFMRNDLYTLDDGEDYDNIVLYIHGGSWTYEIETEHVEFCDELVDRLDAKVYMPLYPLAPEGSYYDSYRMVTELYAELLEQGKPVYVMGDSAGGNIALGVMHLIKKFDYEMPEKLILLSPCADMTFSNDEISEVEPTDPLLNSDMCLFSAKMWAYERELDDPLLSAVYSDTTGFPDTMIIVGTNDILYPDNVKLYKKMKNEGNNVKLVVGKGLWHVFPVYNIPEKEKSLDTIEEFCLE